MEKNHQAFYIRLLAAFLLLALFLTFFSKTFYNAHLPTVTVALPMKGELDHSVEGSGRVSRLEEISKEGSAKERGATAKEMLKNGTDSVEAAKQWKVELLVDEAAADKVDMASQVSIEVKGRMGKLEGSVSNIDFYQKEDGTQGYTITVAFACEDESMEGKKADVKLWKAEEVYDGIVPNDALHKDMKGYFLWTVQEEESVLGNFYAVKRTSVDFLDSDDTHSAVLGLTENMVIIVDGPGDLSEGDRVRYEEG